MSAKGQQAIITALTNTAQTHLFKQFPAHEPRLRNILESRFLKHEVVESKTAQPYTFKPNVPQEEVISIIDKTQQISVLPGLTVDKETELYLEQQLEDVLGFGISSSINSIRVPFTKGVAESVPHLFSQPSLKSNALKKIPEAGLSRYRSFFGWDMPSFSGANTHETTTDYWISLPIRSFVSASMPLANIKQWIHKRKMLLVNPSDSVFAVVEVLDDYTSITNKYQLGVSPAVSREALLWSPQNLGKVLLFFISESTKIPRPGVYSMI